MKFNSCINEYCNIGCSRLKSIQKWTFCNMDNNIAATVALINKNFSTWDLILKDDIKVTKTQFEKVIFNLIIRKLRRENINN